MPKMVRYAMPLVKRQVRGQAEGHGIGRHNKDGVIEMGIKDLGAMSAFLGIADLLFLRHLPSE